MTNFTVPDMSCGHCVKTITDTLSALDASSTVAADLQNKIVSIQSRLSDTEIRQVLTQAGYPPAP